MLSYCHVEYRGKDAGWCLCLSDGEILYARFKTRIGALRWQTKMMREPRNGGQQ